MRPERSGRHTGSHVTRLRWALLAIAAIALQGCAGAPALAPDTTAPAAAGGSLAGSTAQGITVKMIQDIWRYDPRSLPDRITPLHVRIVNGRAEPILVILTDARLLESGGGAYVAMDPGDAVQATVRDAEGSVGGSRGIGIGGIGIQLGGVAVGGPGWGIGPSGVPIGRGGGETEGGMDALRVGIRPGRLDPGASVEGYLFFDRPLRPHDRDRRYRLIWAFRPLTPLGAPPATPVATVEIPMVAR